MQTTTIDAPQRDPSLRPGQIIKHLALLLLTLLTTLVAGMLWQNVRDLTQIGLGLPYALSLLFILSCHEFGHYFAARRHKVSVTLPYFIPLPPIDIISFGTLGAVIRTRQRIDNPKSLFDIGIAGPIAGFIASMVVLAVGFMSLPGPEFILSIHPDFDFAINTIPGIPPGMTLTFGRPLLYGVFEHLFAPAGAWVPPMWEMYHYPLLMTGWFGLFVTAMNLLPVGQLDGGHILFALNQRMHRRIARVVVFFLLFFGLMGLLPDLLHFTGQEIIAIELLELFANYRALFWPGWLFWLFIILFFIKIDHPEIRINEEPGQRRILLGIVAMLIFVLSIAPAPLFFQ